MYLDGLDEIDKRLIQLLTENGRMSYVDLGNEVNLSRVAVKMRVQALEDKGVIEQYTVIINPMHTGSAVSTFLDIEVAPMHLHNTLDVLYNNEAVTQIYQMTGNSNLHVHTVMESNEALEDFLMNTLYKLPGITKVQCSMIMTRIKDVKGLRL